MFSKGELLDAIDELEMSPATYQNAEKLATFYLLYEHLFDNRDPSESIREVTIHNYGDSEFLQTISGMEAEKVWEVIDELMLTIKALQPKLYQATIDKLNSE